mgnify:CR=1 FL=1
MRLRMPQDEPEEYIDEQQQQKIIEGLRQEARKWFIFWWRVSQFLGLIFFGVIFGRLMAIGMTPVPSLLAILTFISMAFSGKPQSLGSACVLLT